MEFAEALKTMQDQRDKILTKIKADNFANSKKLRIFASQSEPTALAYTDFTKPMPTLKGKDAERFITMMEENNRKAEERAKTPPTLDELERRYGVSKMVFDMHKRELEDEENRLKKLEQEIKKIKEENGKTEEE